MNNYWSKVWCRIVFSRVASDTFKATFSVLPQGNHCFNLEYLKKCLESEDAAFDVFEHDFARLRPDIQKAISGVTRSLWIERERADREAMAA